MSIAKEVEEYINQHPSTKDSVKKGIVNYSALSRQISSELKVPRKHFDAVLIACRRYYEKAKKQEECFEDKIFKIIKASKMELKNKRIAVIIEKKVSPNSLTKLESRIKNRGESLTVVEGAGSITLITSEEFANEIDKQLGNQTIKMTKNLVEVILKSPKEIESTPGVVAHLCSLLSENGINIVETMSCWTETLFVIEEASIPAVMKIFGSGPP